MERKSNSLTLRLFAMKPRELLGMPHGAVRDLGSGPQRLRWIWQKRDSAPDLAAKFG